MNIETNNLLSILSLSVALLAVIVGPFVAWVVSKRQSDITLQIANKQILAPIKKEWVESLQKHIAEILSTSLWYYVSGQDENIIISGEEEEHDNETQKVVRKLLFIMSQIELMLNQKNNEHMALLMSLKKMKASIFEGGDHIKFPDYHEETVKICQNLIKNEMSRIEIEIKRI